MNIDQNKVVDLGKGVNQYCGINCNFLSTNKEQIQIIQSSYKQPSTFDNKTLTNITALGLTLLVVIGFVSLISWLQLLQIKKKFRNHLISNKSTDSQLNHSEFLETSCYKCKYFNNNSYLKCAVNPSMVLQPEARECSDYDRES